MGRSLMFFRLALVHTLVTAASAGVISGTLEYQVSLPTPMKSGSLANYSGSAVASVHPSTAREGYVPPATKWPSVSVSNALGSASASSSGPSNAAHPLVLTAATTLSTKPHYYYAEAAASYGFSYEPLAPVSSYFIFPDISMDFSPKVLVGNEYVYFTEYAGFSARQSSQIPGVSAELFCYSRFSVTGTFKGQSGFLQFDIDSDASTMALSVMPGSTISGEILAAATYIYYDAGYISQEQKVVDFIFAVDETGTSVVTRSSNLLGLNLPEVGAAPDFFIPFSGFSASVPAIDLTVPGVKVFTTAETFGRVDLFISPEVPEPSTFFLAGTTVAMLAILAPWLRRRRS